MLLGDLESGIKTAQIREESQAGGLSGMREKLEKF